MLLVILLMTACSRGSQTELDARKLTLELRYALNRETSGSIAGQPGAAPPGAAITCRLTRDTDWRVADGEAGVDGGFELPLDTRPWPFDELPPDNLSVLNESLECRADDGPWVNPLRPPRVAIE